MKQFGLIYRYELKKILGRRRVLGAFALVLMLVLLLNLYSIVLFSVGSQGACVTKKNTYDREQTDWSALFTGVPIRWVDEEGTMQEELVSPLRYIRLQREYAMKWSGTALDDRVLGNLQTFLAQYDSPESEVGTSWKLQNYAWVYRTIYQIGINPESPNLSEAMVERLVNEQGDTTYEMESLTPEEQEFWENHPKLSFPFVLAYTPAYSQLLAMTYFIHILLIFFVIYTLCESFSLERRRSTRPAMQTSVHGMGKAPLARLLAGETVAACAAVICYLLSALIQFSLFGTDGWQVPIQQIGGFQWSHLMICAGNAVLLLFGTSLLLLLFIGTLTMLLSEWAQNPVIAMGVQMVLLLFSLLFNYSIFYQNCVIAQFWQYLPLHRANQVLLYDERLVRVLGRLWTAIPLSTVIYAGLTGLFFLVCLVHTRRTRRDRV
ncbi:MAG: hypothetical protein IJM26_09255 [Lachnospiraceae bacterium]|nr:hypothetical protein [Lachnospiraceae bacterium]